MAMSALSPSPEAKGTVLGSASSSSEGKNVGKMAARTIAGRYWSLCHLGASHLGYVKVHTQSSL